VRDPVSKVWESACGAWELKGEVWDLSSHQLPLNLTPAPGPHSGRDDPLTRTHPPHCQAPRCLDPDTNFRMARQCSHCSCFTKRQWSRHYGMADTWYVNSSLIRHYACHCHCLRAYFLLVALGDKI